MTDNYISIKIKASDAAKPELDDLKGELERLGAMVETAQVDVDDKDSAAKLLDLNARLADLNRKVISPRLTVSGAARIEAQLAAIDLAFDRLGEKTAKPDVEVKGAAKATLEIAALDAELDHLDDKAARAGPGGLLRKILGGAQDLPGIGSLLGPQALAIIPAIAALLPEIAGLASGFAAAGAGAGSFALLAAPSIKKVEAAYTALSTAQAAYSAAQAKEAADPTKSNKTALATAALNLKLAQESVKKMPADAQGAIGSIHDLTAQISNMAQTLAPDVFKVFNSGLKVVKEILPAVLPFASTFAEVLDRLLGQAGKFAGSKGFQDWIGQFHGLEGPALQAIGHGIGQVVIAVGKLITVMSAKDVSHAINIAFGTVTGIINTITGAVKLLMNTWDAVAVEASLSGHMIASAFDSVRHGIAGMGHDMAHDFDDIRHAAATWFHDLAAIFDGIRRTFAEAGHDMAHTFDDIRHAGATWFHDLAAIFDGARRDIASWASGVVQNGGKVITWFRALPARIVDAVGNMENTLVNAGKALIQGLMNGIKSMLGPLGSLASSIGGFIANLKGPIPADLQLLVPHGQAIMQGLMNGMSSRLPQLRGQLSGISRMIGGTAAPGGGYGGGGAAGGALHLVVTGGGSGIDQMFVTWLREQVRVKGGGNVQKAFGRY